MMDLQQRLWRDRLLVLALGVVLFLPALGNRDLGNPDEPRYAEVAREMMLSGDYLVPHYNGEIYTQKPPLLFWTIALTSRILGGVDEVSARLPSALAGIGTLLLTWALGRRFFGPSAAWIAVGALATCYKIPSQARSGQIDMLLTFLVTLAVYFWARGWTEKRPGFYPLFFLAAGLATLAKGPVGLLPPLLAILVFLAWHREWGEVRKLRLGRGLLLWAAVVLAWLVPAVWAAGGSYFHEIVIQQNVTRYANPWHHHQPAYYYLAVVVFDFFPWSFLLPSAVVAGGRRLAGDRRVLFRFALCWMAVTLLFFSLSPAKRTVYILTMYPAMALLIGAGLDRLVAAAPRARAWLAAPLGLLTVLLGAAALWVPHYASRREELASFPAAFLLEIGLTVGLVAVAAAAAFVLVGRDRRTAAIGTLATGAAASSLLIPLVLLPPFDALKSARPLARVLLEESTEREPYGLYPRLDPTYIFYTRRFAVELGSPEELRRFASSAEPGKRVWVLAERDDLAKVKEPLPLVEVARDNDPVEGYVLLVSAP